MQSINESGNVEKAIQCLRDHVAGLGARASDLCQQHFDFVMMENKSKSWKEKSVLFAQTRMRGNSLTANWYEIGWYGSKTAMTRRMTKKLINRQKGDYGYNMAVLLKLAQPWEIDMVQTIEPKLKEIRREVIMTSKAIVLLNHAIKTA